MSRGTMSTGKAKVNKSRKRVAVRIEARLKRREKKTTSTVEQQQQQKAMAKWGLI